MKDLLFLLLLLDLNIIKVCLLPYTSVNGFCLNATTEYFDVESKLCCQRCPPGNRRVELCSETSETVCGPCDPNQYMENWNFFSNCYSCPACKLSKGLETAVECTATRESKCRCLPEHFCRMNFHDPYCSDCQRYKVCKASHGVAEQGTAKSNVKCKPCPEGTFSDTASSSQPCLPHARCRGRVIRNGTSDADTLCEPERLTETTTGALTSEIKVDSVSTPAMAPVLTNATVVRDVDGEFLAAIGGSFGLFFIVFFTVILVFFLKRRKDAQTYAPDFDANGNCQSGYKISRDDSVKSVLALGNVDPPEHFLLVTQEVGQTECCSHTDPRTNGLIRQESTGPLLSTMVLNSTSDTEPVTSGPISAELSFCTNSPRPSRPHIITPVATSPQVNVNITFHIGNTGSVSPSDTVLLSCETKSQVLSQEEEHFSVPQQEAGKECQLPVEEEDFISK